MLKMNKGQLTVFVLIGTIMILVAAYIVFYAKPDLFMSDKTKMENQVSDIVESCVSDSAKNGLNTLGLQGGYISIPNYIKANPLSHLTLGGFILPTWDSIFMQYPTIESMQTELNTFIAQDANACVKNQLKSLDSVMDIVQDKDFTVSTSIYDTYVAIDVNNKITYSKKSTKDSSSVVSYTVKLENYPLGKMYNVARAIYNDEASTHFLEDLVLEQIYTASDYSSPNSMPSEGLLISCAKRIWTIEQLKSNLAQINNANFRYIQFEGTAPVADDRIQLNILDQIGQVPDLDKNTAAYYKSTDAKGPGYRINLPGIDSSYNDILVNVFSPSVEETGARGYFQRYPYRDFQVTPSEGQIVKAIDVAPKETAPFGFSGSVPCIQVYHHLYSLDYDLMVKLSDVSSDNAQFNFQFPIRIVIQRNTAKGAQASLVPEQTKTLTNEAFCSDSERKYPLKISTENIVNNYGVSGVNLTYKCVNVRCDLGTTVKTSNVLPPSLDTKLPYCVNGELEASAKGYHVSKTILTADSTLFKRAATGGAEVISLIPEKDLVVNDNSFWPIKKDCFSLPIGKDYGYVYMFLENKQLDYTGQLMWPPADEECTTTDCKASTQGKLSVLDISNVPYNITVIYMDKDYNLKGYMELKNHVLDVTGNYLSVRFPASATALTTETFMPFYEDTQEKVLTGEDISCGSGGYGIIVQ